MIRTSKIIAVAKNDICSLINSKQIILPMVVLSVIILGVMPALICLGITVDNLPLNLESITDMMAQNMSEYSYLMALTNVQQIIYIVLKQLFPVMFIIVPLLATNFLAADSIAGEKERKTLDAILYSPVSIKELFVGKIMGVWFLSMMLAVISFVIYCCVGNFISLRFIGNIIFPDLLLILIAFYLTPLFNFMGIGIMVIVSSKSKGYREAQQSGGFIVLPPLILVISQVAGLMFMDISFILILGIVILAIDIIVLIMGSRIFANGLYYNK